MPIALSGQRRPWAQARANVCILAYTGPLAYWHSAWIHCSRTDSGTTSTSTLTDSRRPERSRSKTVSRFGRHYRQASHRRISPSRTLCGVRPPGCSGMTNKSRYSACPKGCHATRYTTRHRYPSCSEGTWEGRSFQVLISVFA